MIRLTSTLPKGPRRLDFEGLPYPLWMRVLPPSSPLSEAARAKSAADAPALAEHIAQVVAAGGAVTGLLDMSDPHAAQGMAVVAYARALAELAVIEWGGAAVEDPATDQLVPLSPAAIAELMLWPDLPGQFLTRFLAPQVLVSAEGNASGAASPGISGAAPITAGPVTSMTAHAPGGSPG